MRSKFRMIDIRVHNCIQGLSSFLSFWPFAICNVHSVLDFNRDLLPVNSVYSFNFVHSVKFNRFLVRSAFIYSFQLICYKLNMLLVNPIYSFIFVHCTKFNG